MPPNLWNYGSAAVFAAIWIADLFYFHRLPTDADVTLILSAAAALGINGAYHVGVNTMLASQPPPPKQGP